MPWNELFHGLNNENCTELLLYCIKEICPIKIPKKKKRNKSSIPKERKRLLNQGCEWQIMKKEEKSRVAFRAVRFALKIALYYDFGQYI